MNLFTKQHLFDSITELEPQMRSLLKDSLRIPSVSGEEAEFVRFIRDFAHANGLVTDLWEASEADLIDYPVSRAKHIPLAGRPTLVISLPNCGDGPSILFNAHSDVVSPGRLQDWTFGPWSGVEESGKFYGRGACDVKGPLVSALWAMLAIHRTCPEGWPGSVRLELVPGEEDCVTLGTLTSVVRGYKSDVCIVLEPTECMPRNASRPGLRFEIICLGKSVHGTVKWLGEDAIQLAHQVQTGLNKLESKWNDRSADPLFAAYPIARPITIDTIQGGEWQGMVCSECKLGGYLELLPGDDPASWTSRFEREVNELLDEQSIDGRRLKVSFPESYLGHTVNMRSAICQAAESCLNVSVDLLINDGLSFVGWSGFNSGCEAGLRANLQKTPTLVWGPGSLVQAHAVDEFVEFSQVKLVASLFSRFIRSEN